MRYQFQRQLRSGQLGEDVLDRLFANRFEVERDPVLEKKGIDRRLRPLDGGPELLVEYKTDFRAGASGNAFIETVSVDTTDVPGWAVSSRADFLVYFVPDRALVLVVPFARLRERLGGWLEAHPIRAIPNPGYRTWGVVVPLDELSELAAEVIEVAESEESDRGPR